MQCEYTGFEGLPLSASVINLVGIADASTQDCGTQSDEAAAWEAEKEVENQRLKRHQRVLDKQSRALLKLPNRKERSEVCCHGTTTKYVQLKSALTCIT